MTTMPQTIHERLVSETAQDYRGQGFEVQEKPLPDSMPDFLREFQPDLILKTPEGRHILAEVKAKGIVRRVDYWPRLRDAIAAHPEWELRLIVNNRREEELINASKPLIAQDEVETWLKAGQRLSRQNLPEAALLIIWSALESILRDQAQAEKLKLQSEDPEVLITTLTSEGSLDYDDYGALMKILPMRNQAAHGRRPDNPVEAVKQTLAIARRLLRERARLQEAA